MEKWQEANATLRPAMPWLADKPCQCTCRPVASSDNKDLQNEVEQTKKSTIETMEKSIGFLYT
jgi:hypothetical protein